jgi:hypothetical protein
VKLPDKLFKSTFDKEYVKARLRRAVSAAEQPHYGCNVTEIDNLHEAIDVVCGLIEKLEKN